MNLGMQYNLRNGGFHANVIEFLVLSHLEFPLLIFLPATVSGGLEPCVLDELTGAAKKEGGSLIAFIPPLNNPSVQASSHCHPYMQIRGHGAAAHADSGSGAHGDGCNRSTRTHVINDIQTELYENRDFFHKEYKRFC